MSTTEPASYLKVHRRRLKLLRWPLAAGIVLNLAIVGYFALATVASSAAADGGTAKQRTAKATAKGSRAAARDKVETPQPGEGQGAPQTVMAIAPVETPQTDGPDESGEATETADEGAPTVSSTQPDPSRALWFPWPAGMPERQGASAADAVVSLPSEVPVDGPETERDPHQTAGRVVLHNRRNSGGPVGFLLGDQVIHLAPGETLVGEEAELAFHPGGEQADVYKTLSPGVYVFYVTPEGWTLTGLNDLPAQTRQEVSAELDIL